MEKIYGTNERHDGLQQIGRNNFVLFYGYGEEDGTGYDYRERFSHKPSMEEIKAAVLSAINQDTEAKILSGLTYKGHLVWLSAENQRNYIMGLTTATADEENFKGMKVKLGTDDEHYVYEFKTVAELKEFVSTIQQHIQQCLDSAWQEKGNIDWNIFA